MNAACNGHDTVSICVDGKISKTTYGVILPFADVAVTSATFRMYDLLYFIKNGLANARLDILESYMVRVFPYIKFARGMCAHQVWMHANCVHVNG